MSPPAVLIAGWARSAVAPHGGAFGTLQAHEIAAPVIQALLTRAGIDPERVDAVVIGNALGAGGNPARLVTLAAGLSDTCAAFSIDTQCCAGLDAVSMAVGLIASGQASVVIAGGVEAWSRAPIRQHRPLRAGARPISAAHQRRTCCAHARCG
jgi:acetyl-CoA C-acetyltransferase